MFVPEGVVEATPSDAHRFEQLTHRGGLVPLAPEQLHRRVKRHHGLEFLGPRTSYPSARAAKAGAGRSTMGQCRPAAIVARAIPAHHIGKNVPVCSKANPPSQIPRKAPIWWLKNTIPICVPV